MYIDYYITPRQFGKTARCINYLMNHLAGETVIVTDSEYSAQSIKSKVRALGKNEYAEYIVPSNHFVKFDAGKSFKTIILDEYLFFKDKNKKTIYNEIYRLAQAGRVERVLIYTTSNKLYEFADIRAWHKYLRKEEMSKEEHERIKKTPEIEYTMLEAPECKMHQYVLHESEPEADLLEMFGQEKYMIEVQGHYMKVTE